MSTGYSGTYAFNGSNLLLPPSEGQWGQREQIGTDGNGRPIYPSVRTFTMKWVLISVADAQQIINAQRVVANTGSSVVDLPEWAGSDYLFKSYSGTFINEPQVSPYFAQHLTDVTLLITNIRTD